MTRAYRKIKEADAALKAAIAAPGMPTEARAEIDEALSEPAKPVPYALIRYYATRHGVGRYAYGLRVRQGSKWDLVVCVEATGLYVRRFAANSDYLARVIDAPLGATMLRFRIVAVRVGATKEALKFLQEGP